MDAEIDVGVDSTTVPDVHRHTDASMADEIRNPAEVPEAGTPEDAVDPTEKTNSELVTVKNEAAR